MAQRLPVLKSTDIIGHSRGLGSSFTARVAVMRNRGIPTFGVRMDTLMRTQSAYDIAQIRKHEKQIHVRRPTAVTS